MPSNVDDKRKDYLPIFYLLLCAPQLWDNQLLRRTQIQVLCFIGYPVISSSANSTGLRRTLYICTLSTQRTAIMTRLMCSNV